MTEEIIPELTRLLGTVRARTIRGDVRWLPGARHNAAEERWTGYFEGFTITLVASAGAGEAKVTEVRVSHGTAQDRRSNDPSLLIVAGPAGLGAKNAQFLETLRELHATIHLTEERRAAQADALHDEAFLAALNELRRKTSLH